MTLQVVAVLNQRDETPASFEAQGNIELTFPSSFAPILGPSSETSSLEASFPASGLEEKNGTVKIPQPSERGFEYVFKSSDFRSIIKFSYSRLAETLSDSDLNADWNATYEKFLQLDRTAYQQTTLQFDGTIPELPRVPMLDTVRSFRDQALIQEMFALVEKFGGSPLEWVNKKTELGLSEELSREDLALKFLEGIYREFVTDSERLQYFIQTYKKLTGNVQLESVEHLTAVGVEIVLVEVTDASSVTVGSTYTGMIKIPAWPDSEKNHPPVALDCFVTANNAQLESDERTPGILETPPDFSENARLKILFTENGSEGFIFFRISPMVEGPLDLEFVCFQGQEGGYDPKNRAIWRLVQVTFDVAEI